MNPRNHSHLDLSKLYEDKTQTRHNTMVPGESVSIGGGSVEAESESEYREYAQSSYRPNTDWTKVKKGETDAFGGLWAGIKANLRGLGGRKLMPVVTGLGVLVLGVVLVQNVSWPSGTSEASGLSERALEIVRAEERDAVEAEQRDEQVARSMEFLAKAAAEFDDSAAGDVPLIGDENDIGPTRSQIRENMNLYTTIYLYQDLVEYHIAEMEEAGVENNDLKATMYSLFELEVRAYDNVREIESMLNELDDLYDSDRGRKLELRAVANEQIVRLNQTQAELAVMIERLDRFFVT